MLHTAESCSSYMSPPSWGPFKSVVNRQWLMRRNLFGSDMMILCVSLMHLFEAVALMLWPESRGSIGVAALMRVFFYPWFAAIGLLAVVAMAMVGQYANGIHLRYRLCLLIPQQTMLIVTATGALAAIVAGHYADGVVRSFAFISCDQFPRLLSPIVYTAAIYARVRP